MLANTGSVDPRGSAGDRLRSTARSSAGSKRGGSTGSTAGSTRWAGPGLERRGRRLAAVLAYGAGAVLSHRSAAVHWGLTRREACGRRCDGGSRGRRRAGRGDRLSQMSARTGGRDPPRRDPGDHAHSHPLRSLTEVVDETRLRQTPVRKPTAWGSSRLKELERIVERGLGQACAQTDPSDPPARPRHVR